MVLFKSCPRCSGDMHITNDMYGKYKECLMCGHMIDLPRATPQFNIANETVKRGRPRGKKKKAA